MKRTKREKRKKEMEHYDDDSKNNMDDDVYDDDSKYDVDISLECNYCTSSCLRCHRCQDLSFSLETMLELHQTLAASGWA